MEIALLPTDSANRSCGKINTKLKNKTMSKKQTLQERTSALEFEVKMLEDTIKVLELKNKELTKQLRLGVVGVTFKGKEANIHYKVCDAGEYWLQDENGEKIVKAKGYYVPDFLAIDDSGYGDYIIMKVDKEGKINNWRFDSEPFTNEDEY